MEQVMQLLDMNGDPTAFLHIHLAIFTELGPNSLKSARLVCRNWSKFIKTQMWLKEKTKKILEKRLAASTFTGKPSLRLVSLITLVIRNLSFLHKHLMCQLKLCSLI